MIYRLLPRWRATSGACTTMVGAGFWYSRRHCAADKVTPPRQQRRAAERQGVKALHEYYVLRVRPTYTPHDMRDVGQPTRGTGQRREHMVRGHFRYYAEDRPLFGRTSGMVWIPEHERGDSDIGRIKKDYEL